MTHNTLLALETSCLHGSIAIACDGAVQTTRDLSAERRNAGELLPTIEAALSDLGIAPRDVGCVAFSAGPGSFTGLRVAATIARMWQSSTGCQVVAVPSLDTHARNALAVDTPGDHVGVILDARRQKIFGGLYRRHADDLDVAAAADLHDLDAWLATLPRPCSLLGEGLRSYADAARATGLDLLPESKWRPHARHVATLGLRRWSAGHTCSPPEIVPHYLRPPECEEVYEKRRAEARARRGE